LSFANEYIKKNNIEAEIDTKVSSNLNIIISIPCYNEPNLLKSLDSIWNCQRVNSLVEVILVVNSPENSNKDVISQNTKTIVEFESWNKVHSDNKLKFYLIHKPGLPQKFAGVGLARKIGMDEAVIRFNNINNENGIIVSFDADCKCENNYLTEIEKHFYKYPKTNACSINYEHPVEGDEFPLEIYKSIIQYELYLRYYNLGLKYSGYPYPYSTIGSSFAVKASAYIKQGGMNKRKAGEDFYFLQKIFQLGNFYEINTTKVLPSPRASVRVPFGTGATINKMSIENITNYLTYTLQAFKDLKILFNCIDKFFKANELEYHTIISTLPNSINLYLKNICFYKDIKEINNNCTNISSFKKKFFSKFNGLVILKFMNFSHKELYKKVPIAIASNDLLKELNFPENNIINESELLKTYRNIFSN